jgi:mono/diheme cytochrome c family protein
MMANTGKTAGNGAQVYSQNCSSCHQANGQGNTAFPPLAKNPVVTGPPATVIHIVKNGLTGPVKVNGKTFNGQMPAWKGQLSDGDIAAVISYVRTSWGNKASAVTPAQVTATK